MNSSQWEKKAKNILKAEMKRNGLTYRDLKNRLTEHDIKYEEQVIINKINRGKFSFAFFLQCMSVIGGEKVYLG